MPGRDAPGPVQGGDIYRTDYRSGGHEDGAKREPLEDDEKERDGCSCTTEYAAMSFCILIIVGVGVIMINIGPTKVLRWFLQCIPSKPGWDWYIGMGIVTMISIVMIMPIWPPMCMAAGLIYGLWWGSLLNFFSILGAAICSITIGRYVLKGPVRRWVREGQYPRVRKMMHVLEDSEHSLRFQILFRFLFLPMFIRNYGPSTLHIPLWKLSVACVPHSIWISFLFASLGATFTDAAELIRDGKEASSKDMKWQQLAIFCVSFSVAIGLAVYAQRKYTEYLENEQADLDSRAGSKAESKRTISDGDA